MWKRLAVVWAVMAADIYVIFFVPITVRMTMITAPGAHLTAQQAAENTRGYLVGAGSLALLAILGICIWLNVRIIRRYRKSG
jgi:hypothetical protein